MKSQWKPSFNHDLTIKSQEITNPIINPIINPIKSFVEDLWELFWILGMPPIFLISRRCAAAFQDLRSWKHAAGEKSPRANAGNPFPVSFTKPIWNSTGLVWDLWTQKNWSRWFWLTTMVNSSHARPLRYKYQWILHSFTVNSFAIYAKSSNLYSQP